MRRGRLLLAAALAAALLAGCEKLDRNMWDNPAFLPQEEPVRVAPTDSVPTKGVDHVPLPGTQAAAALKNPQKITDFTLLTGKQLFGIYCTPCHGASGKGDGPVAGKFIPAPVDISATGQASRFPDGELYAILTHGRNGMPPYRGDLTSRERWLIVAYVRTLK